MTTLLILLALTVSVVSAARIYRQRMRDQHREALMNRVIGGPRKTMTLAGIAPVRGAW